MKSSAYSLSFYRQPPYMEYTSPPHFYKENLDAPFYDFSKVSLTL